MPIPKIEIYHDPDFDYCMARHCPKLWACPDKRKCLHRQKAQDGVQIFMVVGDDAGYVGTTRRRVH